MKGHCRCQATGLSSHAIARRREGCMWGGNDYPRDPADLRRCMEYCEEMGVNAERLQEFMSGVSEQWDALLPEWDRLVGLLKAEMVAPGNRGRAVETYHQMRLLLDPTERRAYNT